MSKIEAAKAHLELALDDSGDRVVVTIADELDTNGGTFINLTPQGAYEAGVELLKLAMTGKGYDFDLAAVVWTTPNDKKLETVETKTTPEPETDQGKLPS